MAIRFQPAKYGGRTSGQGAELPIAAAAEFNRGAPVALSGGEIIEFAGGATVTGIVGVALHGTEGAGDSTSPSGLATVAKAHPGQVFLGQCHASAAVETDLSALEIGDTYGVIELAGEWLVDLDDESDVVLTIEKIDDDLDIVWFKFLDSAIVAI